MKLSICTAFGPSSFTLHRTSLNCFAVSKVSGWNTDDSLGLDRNPTRWVERTRELPYGGAWFTLGPFSGPVEEYNSALTEKHRCRLV